MATFKFEVTLTDEMLMGDEYWEEAVEEDGTGISTVTEDVQRAIFEEFFPMGEPYDGFDINEVVQLKKYLK